MFELIDTKPHVDVPEAEYLRLLGYPKRRGLEGRARELADEARAWFAVNGRPWIYAREVEDLELKNGQLWMGAMEFSSKRLHDIFAGTMAHSAVLLAVSAGRECEEHALKLWNEGKPDEYYFLKIFGSAVVEHLVMLASGRICGRADENKMAVLPHFSPGYSGWDIQDQSRFWSLFKGMADGRFPGELEVLESGMLRPEKSLLAVFGQTRDLEKAGRFAQLVPCETCALPNCRFRRAVYKRSWREGEMVVSGHGRYSAEC
jgi:hypothetical protein